MTLAKKNLFAFMRRTPMGTPSDIYSWILSIVVKMCLYPSSSSSSSSEMSVVWFVDGFKSIDKNGETSNKTFVLRPIQDMVQKRLPSVSTRANLPRRDKCRLTRLWVHVVGNPFETIGSVYISSTASRCRSHNGKSQISSCGPSSWATTYIRSPSVYGSRGRRVAT
jgi:hypothetical protein